MQHGEAERPSPASSGDDAGHLRAALDILTPSAAAGDVVAAPSEPLTLAFGPGDVGLRLAVQLTPKLTCLGTVAAFSATSSWHTICYDDGMYTVALGQCSRESPPLIGCHHIPL